MLVLFLKRIKRIIDLELYMLNKRKKNLIFIMLFVVTVVSAFATEPLTTVAVIPDTVRHSIDTISTDSVHNKRKWSSSDTYISGSLEWRNEDDEKAFDFDIRFGANFTGRLDEIDVKLDSKFVLKNTVLDQKEQNFRVNWYHTLHKQFYLVGQGRLERDQKTYDGIHFDYLILLGGAGPGYHFETKKMGSSRLSVMYNYLQLIIIKGDTKIHSNAPSVYFDNNYQLAKKINLKNWTNIYFWTKDDIGFEIETEMAYSITKNLALGVRYYVLYNGPTLKHEKSTDLRIFTKITF